MIKAGLRVPEDVLLVSMANEGIEHHYGVDVVRYYLSPTEVAKKLVSVLRQRMKDGNAEVPQIITGDWGKSAPVSKTRKRETVPV